MSALLVVVMLVWGLSSPIMMLVRAEFLDAYANDPFFKNWLDTSFKSADPAWQHRCELYLKNGTIETVKDLSPFSQASQDLFLFYNIFKYWPVMKKNGFYVESGANDAFILSNTVFYDKCLGWQGLCIEPNPEYADGFKDRSCTYVPECVSATNQELVLSNTGVRSKILTPNLRGHGRKKEFEHGLKVKCSPFEDMLKKAGASKVDFWSLDVEGFEETILRGVDFSKTVVNVLLMEDFWLTNRNMDFFINSNRFVKYHQMAIDSAYLRRSFLIHNTHEHDEFRKTLTSSSVLPGPQNHDVLFYPPKWKKDWNDNMAYRDAVRHLLAPC